MTQSHTFQNNYLKRIMVVEGNPSLRIGIVNYLMLEGYTVTGVGSALDFYLQFIREPYLIAIIDTDLNDQDGLVVAEYARKNTDIRIITLSEPLTSSTIPANIKAGADLNLVKPIDLRLLGAAVRTLLSRLDTPDILH
ncbi:MAG: response regulator [Chlorobium sp.]|jgi:DNA-binding response OmpR family regulator